MIEVIFSHGKEGSPNGSKSKIIKKICQTNNTIFTTIDYKDCETVDERVVLLESEIRSKTNDLILVGSSMGGYVSAVCSNKYSTLGLFLIAPALYLSGYEIQHYQSMANNITVRHGWDDETIPVENSFKFCKIHNCSLIVEDDNHRMSKTRVELENHFQIFLNACKTN
jgi:predicted peptidase